MRDLVHLPGPEGSGNFSHVTCPQVAWNFDSWAQSVQTKSVATHIFVFRQLSFDYSSNVMLGTKFRVHNIHHPDLKFNHPPRPARSFKSLTLLSTIPAGLIYPVFSFYLCNIKFNHSSTLLLRRKHAFHCANNLPCSRSVRSYISPYFSSSFQWRPQSRQVSIPWYICFRFEERFEQRETPTSRKSKFPSAAIKYISIDWHKGCRCCCR